MDCIQPESIVCGCDGRLYRNECEANAYGGVDTQPMSGCPMPPGTFTCGTLFCAHGTQYCESMGGGATINGYACHDLPAGCGGTPTCACIQGTALCGNCTVLANGDIRTSCLFP
jgi:hypothetical protein